MEHAMEMARIAYDALSDKKGENIQIIDISGVSVLADYFIITDGTSDSQIKALHAETAGGIEQRFMGTDGLRRYHRACV